MALSLGIVGDGGYFSKKVRSYASRFPEINYFGLIQDKNELKTIYRQHDIFIMPSYRETFGLVYVEALTQGLSLIIGRGEGVDGMFDEVAVKVNPFSVKAIENGILTALTAHNAAEIEKVDLVAFNWADIGKDYFELLKLYKDEK
ncbi:hypothetical protein GCM10007415_10670 [Parapedobacter pyrenivorans]|uniref:Glycosyl transferase family 1 domain-containing protein n=2 Tax=Parapedobacter pyrenivorans TaxID=1305674 RepID=A0A917HIB4_9SPHI|nr:hypothetical protein GCM10007415_10670 [Parapedobacter pyrenivorans]